METKLSPRSAKVFLLEELFAQAALDDVSFSELELRLLRDNEGDRPISDLELEGLESKPGFFELVARLLRRARERFNSKNPGSHHFGEAISQASENDDYFGVILWDKFLADVYSPEPARGRHDSWIILAIAIPASILFLTGLVFLLENGASIQSWTREFLAQHPAIARIRVPYVPWLQDSDSWFQRSAGRYMVTALIALGLTFWTKLIWRSIEGRRTGSSH